MRSSFHLSSAAVIGALALGCGDHPSPTTPTDDSPSVSTAPGDAHAASVERTTLDIGFPIFDEERGLTAVFGNTFAELAVICAAGTAPSGMPVLIVTRPTGAVKLLLKNPEAEVVVWQLVSGDLCGVLATTEPYAEGTVRLRLNDNEASDFPIGPGGNAVSIHAKGTVTVVETGEELDFRAFEHYTLPPGSTSFEDLRLLRSEIVLR
jgi:hypothetical protein